MKVSIVIPCYRQGRYLREAVDSCLSQTYPTVEVVVVNDGSDDDTDAVARSYADRIRYVHKPNGGLCAARNSGIAVATGQYMKFLDADDHLHPEQLARQMDALAGRQDRVGVTTARAYREDDPSVFTDTVPDLRNLLPDMFAMPDIPPHAWMFPADLVRKVNGFHEAFSPAGDWDFVTRVGKLRPEVSADSRVGCYYRLRTGSMSTTNRRGTTIEVAQRLIEMHDEFRDGPNRDWFGAELLGAEQATYRRLLLGGFQESHLQGELLRRIRELRAVVGAPAGQGGRKFEALCRVIGYPLAERVVVRYAQLRRRLRPRSTPGAPSSPAAIPNGGRT